MIGAGGVKRSTVLLCFGYVWKCDGNAMQCSGVVV